MLLGGYSSEEEGGDGSKAVATAPAVASKAPLAAASPARSAAEAKANAAKAAFADAAPKAKDEHEAVHGPFCMCEECEVLLARFAAKNMQTKGIRFKCKICAHLAATKADAADHFRALHTKQLQDFKREKEPRLFAAKKTAAPKAGAHISFARDDVLRKRQRDDADSFGGWSKKEKPAPPPCELPEFQAMQEPIIQAAAPWITQARPSNEDATIMDKEVDRHIAEAQMKRFCQRNILAVKSDVVRCKLCMKTFGSSAETSKHIQASHEEDFQKEIGIWERFLHMHCKRQPPFGWVCKVCTTFYPTDGAVWRHLGKEVFIRMEERHIDIWREKEDRWGHEEDEECCGDGLNARGLSFDSVRLINQQLQQEEMETQARQMDGGGQGAKEKESDVEEEVAEEAIGVKQFIQEF